MITDAVINGLCEILPIDTSTDVGIARGGHTTWLRVDTTRSSGIPKKRDSYTCFVSPCSGGAWQQFGTFTVEVDHISLALKTVNAMVNRRLEFTTYDFQYCCPDFPDNFIELVKIAARNANFCFRFAHDKSWKHYNRELRRKKQCQEQASTG